MLIRVIAAENTLQKHSLAQFEEYEQEKVFAKFQIRYDAADASA